MIKYQFETINNLNKAINEHFNHLFPITKEMSRTFDGISRLVMLDRYAQRDLDLKTLKEKDLVICLIKDDPRFPTMGIGLMLLLQVLIFFHLGRMALICTMMVNIS